jgi:hypothetical protein
MRTFEATATTFWSLELTRKEPEPPLRLKVVGSSEYNVAVGGEMLTGPLPGAVALSLDTPPLPHEARRTAAAQGAARLAKRRSALDAV